MATWSDYKNHVRKTNPEIAKDVDEVEALSQIVAAMIEQRHNLDLSQRDLAELCGLPHSSVARIESGKSSPNLSTLLKIFKQLALAFQFTQQPQENKLQFCQPIMAGSFFTIPASTIICQISRRSRVYTL